jgi:hypothetical protein
VWLYSVALILCNRRFSLKTGSYTGSTVDCLHSENRSSTCQAREPIHRRGQARKYEFCDSLRSSLPWQGPKATNPDGRQKLVLRKKRTTQKLWRELPLGSVLYFEHLCSSDSLVTHTSTASSTICSFTKGREVLTSNRPRIFGGVTKKLQRWLEEDEAVHCYK